MTNQHLPKPTAAENAAEIARSYNVRIPARTAKVTTRATFLNRIDAEDNYERLVIPAGTWVSVRRDVNAGFRGIEARISVDGGWSRTVSTGMLR